MEVGCFTLTFELSLSLLVQCSHMITANAQIMLYNCTYVYAYTVWLKTLAVKKFNEFGKPLPIHQSFLTIFLFCSISHTQQCEVCLRVHFNLFCVRIEVTISILQYFKRSNSLSSDSLLIYS